MRIETSALEIAMRYIGTSEVSGMIDNPLIMAMLRLDADWPEHDEVPWCSAFVNWIAWHLGLSRSGSLMARSWLAVGEHIEKEHAEQGLDIVVLSRGSDQRFGHVGFFYQYNALNVGVVGGNQGDRVSLVYYDIDHVLGVRRLVKG